MEPTVIDCTKISKNKEMDAYLDKFKQALAESIIERRIFYYFFKFSCFQVAFYSRIEKVKGKELYQLTIYIEEFMEGGVMVIYPASDHRFKSFEWVSKFNGHFAAFFLNKNGPELLKLFFQILKNVFKVDILIAFS